MFKIKKSVFAEIIITCIFLLCFFQYEKSVFYNKQIQNGNTLSLKNVYTELSEYFQKPEVLNAFNSIPKSCCFYSKNKDCDKFFEKLKKQNIKFEVKNLENYEFLYLNQQASFRLTANASVNNDSSLYSGKALSFDRGFMLTNYRFYKNPKIDKETEKFYGNRGYKYIGLFDIDTNGEEKPNMYGRDIFRFLLLDDGTLYPYMGVDYMKSCKKDKGGHSEDNTGLSCAARVMNDGWKIRY